MTQRVRTSLTMGVENEGSNLRYSGAFSGCEDMLHQQPSTHTGQRNGLARELPIVSSLEGVMREQFEKWRVGSKVPINVYEGDRPVCQCHTVADAKLIVQAVNTFGDQVKAALKKARSARNAGAI